MLAQCSSIKWEYVFWKITVPTSACVQFHLCLCSYGIILLLWFRQQQGKKTHMKTTEEHTYRSFILFVTWHYHYYYYDCISGMMEVGRKHLRQSVHIHKRILIHSTHIRWWRMYACEFLFLCVKCVCVCGITR